MKYISKRKARKIKTTTLEAIQEIIIPKLNEIRKEIRELTFSIEKTNKRMEDVHRKLDSHFNRINHGLN